MRVNSNKEDLKLIEEMGITPDVSYHVHKPSLKTAALAVIAAQRMQRLSKDWAGNRKVHAELVRKLEGMRRTGRRSKGAAGVAR